MRALRCFLHSKQRVGGDRLALPFQLQQPLLANLHRRRDEPERLRAEQHLPRLRRLLQPRRDIDRVAGRQTLLGAGQHLPGVHADPALDPQLRQCIPHLHRRPTSPQRIILMHHRDTEHSHHRVPDELLHRATMRLNDALHPLEVARQQPLQRLRIHRLPQRRRPDNVAEQHRHDLPVCADRHETRLEHERSRT